MKSAIYFRLLAACFLIQAGPAAAHSVHVFAYAENSMIKGEGSLGGDKKIKDGDIQVFRKSDNKLLLTTRTDDNGLFSFAVEQLNQKEPVDLLIVINAGPGHRSEWNLDVDQYVPPAAPHDPADPEKNRRQAGTINLRHRW